MRPASTISTKPWSFCASTSIAFSVISASDGSPAGASSRSVSYCMWLRSKRPIRWPVAAASTASKPSVVPDVGGVVVLRLPLRDEVAAVGAGAGLVGGLRIGLVSGMKFERPPPRITSKPLPAGQSTSCAAMSLQPPAFASSLSWLSFSQSRWAVLA